MPIAQPGAVVYTRPAGLPYIVDFATAAIQDPLDPGGVWTNNSKGSGGNAVMGTLASMRNALADDGTTRIAQHQAAAITDLDDSFAFVPGFIGNQRATTVIYRGAGYAPTANHEIESIMGCSINAPNDHHWLEFLWNDKGGADFVLLDGAYNSYTALGVSGGPGAASPADGDIWVCELDRTNRIARQKVNGTTTVFYDWSGASAPLIAKLDALSTGIGIASYRTAGDTASGGLGFRSFRAETF